jgi:glycosyltransferase involved in cell wall biosynthesis
MVCRVDLHVHSKYSDRPSEWILRRIGAPECHTEPKAVYEIARRRGMRFVTITDHNCIQGALEIAHLPDVFVGNEITTYFPEDGCKVHVLVWDINERQFEEIQRLRENIYELRDYLWSGLIPHSCAHPLYSINDRLTVEHFEKLILLFNVFETMNGARNQRGNDLVNAVLKELTQPLIGELEDRYRITPIGEQPWVKGFTGGSDDHSGIFLAKGFTECPDSESYREYLDHVFRRCSVSGGLHGTPLNLAHSLYSIGYQYYRNRFLSSSKNDGEVLLKVLGEVFGREQFQSGLGGKASHYVRRISGRREKPAETELKHLISGEMRLLAREWLKDDHVADPKRCEELNRQTFDLACRISNSLLFQFSKRFVKKLSNGSVFGSLEALSALTPVALGVAPYVFSFAHQNRDKRFLSEVCARFFGVRPEASQRPKKAWFTDTLEEVNGVTTLVQKMCGQAERRQHELTLISFSDTKPDYPGRVQNFKPVGQFTLPENKMVTLSFPPILEVLEFCEREQFTELIISTPGLAGLAALAAGKMMGTRMIGIYHTDLPQYIRYHTEDEVLEGSTWRYLCWFYEQMDLVFVPSRVYRQQLIERGFDPTKLRHFPHGTDIDAFHPRHRQPDFWEKYGRNGGPKVIYVGRVAKEKDLDILIDVYGQLAQRRPDCTLAVIGDGPFLPLMKERLPYPNIVFTGFLLGQELSQAYASSDVFAFPSTTDTFGNVVLEAMASGLPVVVSDKGGPKEIVQNGRTGLVAKGRDAPDLLRGIEMLIDDQELRSRMAKNCRSYAEKHSWENIYHNFWNSLETS